MHFNNEHAYIYQLPLKCNIQYVILLIMMYLHTMLQCKLYCKTK